MTRGSHTNFDTDAFTVGAVGGALSIGSALAVGWQNYRQAQRQRWAEWTVAQLQAALDCSESMRFGLHNDLNAARVEIAGLKRKLADREFEFKRDAAHRARARR